MRAVVLGGGGSKGSYEIGAWEALQELEYHYEIVTGTSIGAINGAFMVMNELETAKDLWYHITMKDVIRGEKLEDYHRDQLLLDRGNLTHLIKSYLQNGSLDITPLKQLVEKKVDSRKIKHSPCKFGIVTLQIPFLMPLEITSNEMKEEDIPNYLLASSACFPAFPVQKVHNKYYIDGGYYDNLPIDFAFQLGAEEIVAIDLHDKKLTHRKYLNHPRVHYIKPSWDLGSFLHFDSTTIRNNMALGYYDTLKHFKKLDGIRYAFEKDSSDTWNDLGLQYKEILKEFQLKYPSFRPNILLEETTKNNPLPLSTYHFFLLGMENCMELLRFSPYQLYKIAEIKKELQEHHFQSFSKEERDFFKDILFIKDIYDMGKQKGEEYLMKFLSHAIQNPKSFTIILSSIIKAFPRQVAAILFLQMIEERIS